MTDVEPVHAEFEDDIRTPLFAVLVVMRTADSRNLDPAEIINSVAVEDLGIPLNHFEIVVIVVVVA